MAYQALYRVWRPQKFSEVIGQTAITQTLRNAVATKQVSHAYLFTGPRGTGKTSCSKILAKAVNCQNPQAGEPCNQCPICQAINDGSLSDVLEIDAASNNGVEQIRDIREKVKYAPTQAEYKIYIIDEVHMLSTGAFNALLKTLEEPPAKVIFILATTEPQKIPATIISRTQRFDFRRITAVTIFQHLEDILNQKQITYDAQALRIIAQAAEGGMRDALSILDQALALPPDNLTVENALQVTGTLDKQQLESYFQAVSEQQTAAALEALHQIMASGRSAKRFGEAIIEVCRDLLLVKTDPQLLDDFAQTLISPKILNLQSAFSNEQLYRLIDVTSQTQQQLKTADQPLLYLEVLTVKLIEVLQTQAKTTTQSMASKVQHLQTEVEQLKQMVKTLQTAPPKTTTAASSPTNSAQIASAKKPHAKVQVDRTKINHILQTATRPALQAVQEVWPDLMNMLSVTQRAIMKVSKPVAASADGIVVAFDYAVWFERVMSNQEMLTMLKVNLDKLLANQADVVLVAAEDWPQLRQDFLKHHDLTKAPTSVNNASNNDSTNDSTANDLVTQAQKLFGKEAVEVKAD